MLSLARRKKSGGCVSIPGRRFVTISSSIFRRCVFEDEVAINPAGCTVVDGNAAGAWACNVARWPGSSATYRHRVHDASYVAVIQAPNRLGLIRQDAPRCPELDSFLMAIAAVGCELRKTVNTLALQARLGMFVVLRAIIQAAHIRDLRVNPGIDHYSICPRLCREVGSTVDITHLVVLTLHRRVTQVDGIIEFGEPAFALNIARL